MDTDMYLLDMEDLIVDTSRHELCDTSETERQALLAEMRLIHTAMMNNKAQLRLAFGFEREYIGPR